MDSSECGVKAMTSLPATSTSSSTLMTGPPGSVGAVRPRTPAETEAKNDNMHGDPYSMQSMVLTGLNYARVSFGRLNSYTFVTIPSSCSS